VILYNICIFILFLIYSIQKIFIIITNMLKNLMSTAVAISMMTSLLMRKCFDIFSNIKYVIVPNIIILKHEKNYF